MLIRKIKEGLEKNRNYNIDRRTVKAIVNVLETEGLLQQMIHKVRDPELYRGITSVNIVTTPGYQLNSAEMDNVEAQLIVQTKPLKPEDY